MGRGLLSAQPPLLKGYQNIMLASQNMPCTLQPRKLSTASHVRFDPI